jgi:hypothetical protein
MVFDKSEHKVTVNLKRDTIAKCVLDEIERGVVG